MQLKFIYTNMPFWRAEVGRITLFIGDVEFEDLRIDREEFLRAKESGKLDDGKLSQIFSCFPTFPSLTLLTWTGF